MVVFDKICHISHVYVGIMKILKMAKKVFQWPVFCKWLTNISLISNHKVAISAYSKTAKIMYLIYLQFTYIKQIEKHFLQILRIIQKLFSVIIKLPNLPECKILRHVRNLEKVKNGSFFNNFFVQILSKFSESPYSLLGWCRNVNIGLFWEVKMQFLKNVVWLILSKQCES